MIRVKGYSNLFRDEKTGAIVNTDDNAYDQYIKKIKSDNKKNRELDDIKKDIQDIKEALSSLINNLKN